MDQLDIIMTALQSFWDEVARFAPRLLGALLILIIGWIIAKLLRAAVSGTLKTLRFDLLAEKSGIEQFLKQGDIHVNLRTIVSEVCYWMVMLMVMMAVANSLKLEIVAELFNRVTLYLPNVLVAIFILVLGSVLARFVGNLTLAYLNNIGATGAKTISNLASYALLVFVLFVALEQLKIGTEIVASAFKIGFGAICLALALAFGLGGKDWAAAMLNKIQFRLEHPGDSATPAAK